MSARPLAPLRPALVAVALAAIVFGLAAATPWADPSEKPAVPASPRENRGADSLRFVAYYFHGNARCATCRKLEQYSEAAVRGGFAEELESARLAWRAVNVDKKENAHFTDDFQLYTRSLVLVAEHDGKVVRWKNLPRIWELVRDADAFAKYVQAELRGFMKASS